MFGAGNAGLGEPVAADHQLTVLPHSVGAKVVAVLAGFTERFPYGFVSDNSLGKIWVGEGARPTSDGTGLVSADGTRIYRSPKEKPNTPGSLNPTGTQANFESYTKNIETGKMDKIGNGHLNILGGK